MNNQNIDRWISVEEELPELMCWVLIYRLAGQPRVIQAILKPKTKKFKAINESKEIPMNYVTHWVPLPELPKK